MCNKVPAVLLVGTASLAVLGAASHSRSASIQGVWRTAEVTTTGPNAMTAREPVSLGIITAKHYSRVEIHGDPDRPVIADVAVATADQLRATWGPFFAEAGTYELSGGNELTMRPLIARNPAAMSSGWFVTYAYELSGDTLSLVERRNQRGPIANPTRVKLVRVE
jgi:hypothetical protein